MKRRGRKIKSIRNTRSIRNTENIKRRKAMEAKYVILVICEFIRSSMIACI